MYASARQLEELVKCHANLPMKFSNLNEMTLTTAYVYNCSNFISIKNKKLK